MIELKEEEKEVFYKILTETKHCVCGVSFICTDNCPPERWGGLDKPSHVAGACFCKKCLLKSKFKKDYIDNRLKYCYFKDEERT